MYGGCDGHLSTNKIFNLLNGKESNAIVEPAVSENGLEKTDIVQNQMTFIYEPAVREKWLKQRCIWRRIKCHSLNLPSRKKYLRQKKMQVAPYQMPLIEPGLLLELLLELLLLLLQYVLIT